MGNSNPSGTRSILCSIAVTGSRQAASRQNTGRDPTWQMLDDFWLFLGEHQGKAASDQESKDPWRAGGHRGLSGDNRLPGMC